MYRNRMIQLTKIAGKSQRVGSKLDQLIDFPINPQPFEYVNRLLNTFVSNNHQINTLRNQYKKTANPFKQKELTGKVTAAVQHNKTLMGKLQTEVNKINEEQKKNFEAGRKQDTVRVAQINKRTNQALMDFRDSQERFTGDVKDTIRRQATIMQGDISEGEVENIMKNPQQGQEMLRAKLLDHPSVELDNAVSDIIDKYRQILELQKNMQECLQMMQDMALLVALNGQQLNSIQATIIEASDYVENADAKLIKAKQHHKAAKSKMCCIIMLLMAAIGAVVIPVVITQLG